MDYTIKSGKYIFHAKVKQEPYMYYIKIGTRNFGECIEISISDKKAKLIQVKSEPECGYPQFLEKGSGTTDMIKASLDFCFFTFGASVFEFDDASNMDCNPVYPENSKPPRKLNKPFSLAHHSIALYGMTWYERHFGATMINSENYKRYRKSIENLYKPITTTYEDFIKENLLNEEQIIGLKEYYEKASSLNDFFKSVPKKDNCRLFFNWLPTCIESILNDTFYSGRWCIDIHNYRHPTISIGNSAPVFTRNSLSKKGGGPIMKFSNDMSQWGHTIF